jgi:choline dehydrogenase
VVFLRYLTDPCYLKDPRDVEMLRCGLRTARALVQRQVERKTGFWALEVFPGPLFAYAHTKEWFEFFARMMANTYFHACGTCRMEVPPQERTPGENVRGWKGVVDDQLRVHGVRGLRVADASVIPAIPSSPTQALCMVIGQACGDLLLAKE